MARVAESPRPDQASPHTDLISRISDTIANHSRLSAAAAFQLGVLLGQVMSNTGAMKSLKRTVARAPNAIASSFPTFGLFDSKSETKRRPKRKRRAATARSRQSAKKATASKRRKRAQS